MISQDLLTILRIYFVSLVLGLVSWPATRVLFNKLPDNGWSLTRIFTTLFSALIVWEIGNLGLPVNNTTFLIIVTGILLVFNLLIAWDQAGMVFRLNVDLIKVIVIEEYLFLVGFFVVTIARGFMPNIDSLEKFMDFGFVNRYLSTSVLPTQDMWQAGKIINYYSFGHFWASILIRFFNVLPATGYNIVLGFIAGLTMQISFGVILAMTSTKNLFASMMGGVIGAFGVAFAGNTHIIWYMLKEKGLTGYWYADATRFIYNTIHEFPGYSFVVADLHGHLLDLPIVLAFILVATHWIHFKQWKNEIIMGIFFGVMMMTNTWDVAVYGLFLVVAGIQFLFQGKKNILFLIRSAGVMLLFMAITALPWWLSFNSISNGIAAVSLRSELWKLAALWSGGLIVVLMSVITEGHGINKNIIRTMALTIVLLIIIPEIVYAKDIYPDHPRANTMFKLTYQASAMIGLLLGSLWGRLFDSERKMSRLWRLPATIIMIFFFCGTMIFPAQAFTTFYNNFENYQGLNGERWLETSTPEIFGAVNYLRANFDGKNLVESVGDSYTHENSISVFSGVPSIQGWRVHEWLWRGGYEVVATRAEDVRVIYEDFDQKKTNEIIKKYNVGWIYVGNYERGQYKVSESKILSLGEEVWRYEDAYLIRVK